LPSLVSFEPKEWRPQSVFQWVRFVAAFCL